jgi:hypothetical protein
MKATGTQGGLDLQAIAGAECRPQAGLDVHQPHPPALAGEDLGGQRAVRARAVVGDPQDHVGIDVAAHDLHPATPAALHTVADRVLHQRLERQHREHGGQDLGRDLEAHLEAIAEPAAVAGMVRGHP